MPTSVTLSQRASLGNRLQNEVSRYLRQHADNPVDWYPWGEDALNRSRREEKPIFLSIGYSSCHWCHVMESEVFENEEIADYLNENFVCIKVDREERPDLDRIYMEAVQALTRSGGWPLSVWLTPELKPFFGGTYFAPERFMLALKRLRTSWTENRDQLEDTAEQLFTYISRSPLAASPEAMSFDDIKAIGEQALSQIDHLYGGFEGPMKFPVPLRMQLMLHLYRRTGDERYSKAVRDTLVAMASGGLQDHVGGGFHRYTVDATWTVPHFEKMLYDNAQLASLYLEAAAVFEDKALFARVAQRTLNFLLDEMYDAESGGFYGSFDADSEGEEGSYYVWTPEEIRRAAGPEDAEALCMLFGVTEAGNFAGNRTVLTRRYPYPEVVARTGKPLEELKNLVNKYRPALLAERAKRIPPGLDRKIVTSWNALAISALAQGYRLFGFERYLDAAEKTVSFLYSTHRHGQGSMLHRSSTGREHSGDGVLDDYSILANALLDLFEASGTIRHLEWAVELAKMMEERFRHELAGFYHTPSSVEAPLGRQVEIHDSVEPGGLSMALRVFLRLAAIQGREDYLELVKGDIEAYSETIKRAGLEMAGWVDVALLLHGPFYQLVIARSSEPVGSLPKKSDLRLEAERLLAPYLQMIPLADDIPTENWLELIPLVEDKPADEGRPTAYLCQNGTCQAPTASLAELLGQIRKEWKR